MSKRKQAFTGRRPQPDINEYNSSSDSNEWVETRQKRIRSEQLSFSGSSIGERSPDYNNENILDWNAEFVEDNVLHSDRSFSDDDYPGESTHQEGLIEQEEENSNSRLVSSNQIVNEEEEKPVVSASRYEGFESFMKSFHFLSDSEDAHTENDQDTIPNENLQNSNETLESSRDITRDFYEAGNVPPDSTKKIWTFPYHLKRREIVFINCPTSVPLLGHLRVTLIHGRASIQGYELKIKKPVTVYSQKQTGLLSLVSHFFEKRMSVSVVCKEVNSLLPYSEHQTIRNHVRRNCVPLTVIVVLQELHLPPNLQFLQLYSPEAVSFRNTDSSDRPTYMSLLENDRHALNFGMKYAALFSKIEKHLLAINKARPASWIKPENAADADTELDEPDSESDMEQDGQTTTRISGYRILIYGPKKSGKSTLSRYLINKFLNSYREVFYLDTDPGQTEFTPPGAVSLTRVTEPLFGPPYTHQLKPLKMIYTGTITAESSPPMHTRSIVNLLDYFKAEFPRGILIVNTMGWITGIGDMILEVVKKNVMAAVEIELATELLDTVTITEGRILKCKMGFDRDSSTSVKKGEFRPNDLRDWALLSYLGKCQQHFMQPTYLNAMRPVCVRWDDVAVYNFNKRLPYNRFYEALNCSVVALCHVDECFMLMSTNPDYPNTLDDEPNNECLGYGLVRAVDEEHHLLYVITPVELYALKRVNALISGNITVPRSVLLDQPLLDTELYYTDESKQGRTEARKAIRRRSRITLPKT